MSLKNEHDGPLREYRFGQGNEPWRFKTDSLAKAVRAFRVGALYPHQYVDRDDRIETERLDERGYTDEITLASKPGATVPVLLYLDELEEDRLYGRTRQSWKEIARIPPEGDDAKDFSLKALPLQVQAQLAAAEATGSSTALTTTSGSPGMVMDLSNASRAVIEQKRLDLEAKKGQLELMKRELAQQISALNAEVERRLEQIWAIELFLGTHEEVKCLAEGRPAPEDTTISVHQRTLCMDEEVAIWDWFHNPDRIGKFDYKDLNGFDRWLVEDPAHLNIFLPEPKGIVAIRIRRKEKDRGRATSIGMAMQHIEEEEADRKTYLLIRNGENVYRIWADVRLWPRFFPRIDEFDWLQKDLSWREREEEKAREKMKHFIGGLLAIQGLLERSDLLHPLPAAKIDIFKSKDVDEYFALIRNDESQLKIGDGSDLHRVTWKIYDDWLHDQTKVGARVLWKGQSSGWHDSSDQTSPLERRTHIASVSDYPDKSQFHVIDRDESKHGDSWRSYDWSFLYLPDDMVPDGQSNWGSYWDEKKRERRVRFRVYNSEVTPFDALSWRVIEYLLHDRSQRPEYAEFFTTFFHWWKRKKDEAAQEAPFIDLILGMSGVDRDNEAERARCERLLRWWKLKTKLARTIDVDEAKAVRMISKAFKKGQDHEDDPETKLMEALHACPPRPVLRRDDRP